MDNTSSRLIWSILFWVLWVRSAHGGTESMPVTIPGPTISSNPFTEPYGPMNISDPFTQHNDTSLRGSNVTEGCGNKTEMCQHICRSCGGDLSNGACFTQIHVHYCYMNFVHEMAAMNDTNLCSWKNINRPYNTFTLCSEDAADCLMIPWPNIVVEETFVWIHSSYFRDCPEELKDPPASMVFALVMAPICLIPLMVVLVVHKTKNGDGSSW